MTEALWRRMLGLYGHTWASQYGDAPTGSTADTWASALIGLTPQQIADGLRACVASGDEFPPNAPRFRAMCMGIPSFATVKRETLRPDAERSPFTRTVWFRVDVYAHRHASVRDADRMLQAAYDAVREEVMRGAVIDPPAALIEHDTSPKPQGIPATREERAERLRKLLGEDYIDPMRKLHSNSENTGGDSANEA